jgi:hypothetical protein
LFGFFILILCIVAVVCLIVGLSLVICVSLIGFAVQLNKQLEVQWRFTHAEVEINNIGSMDKLTDTVSASGTGTMSTTSHIYWPKSLNI